jgi:hypothetical protein
VTSSTRIPLFPAPSFSHGLPSAVHEAGRRLTCAAAWILYTDDNEHAQAQGLSPFCSLDFMTHQLLRFCLHFSNTLTPSAAGLAGGAFCAVFLRLAKYSML